MLCNKSLLFFLDALHNAVDSFDYQMTLDDHQMTQMTLWWLQDDSMITPLWIYPYLYTTYLYYFKFLLTMVIYFQVRPGFFLVDLLKKKLGNGIRGIGSWNEIIWTPHELIFYFNYVTVKGSNNKIDSFSLCCLHGKSSL